MKKIVICLLFVVLFAGLANAQTKSVTGKVIDEDSGASGRFDIRTITVGGKRYSFYIFSADGKKSHNPEVIGDVGIGKTVRVYYSQIVSEGNGYALTATKIVEVKPTNQQNTQSFEDWPFFWQTFQNAVLRGDRTTVKSLMSRRFEWALDGYISRDEAFSYLDSMKVWPGLRNAVTRKPLVCAQHSCRNRSGYHVSSSPKYSTEIMFEKIDGRWWWTGVLGD